MATHTFPSALRPHAGSLLPIKTAARLQSPYAGVQQVLGYGGEALVMAMQFNILDEAQRRAMIAFLVLVDPTDDVRVHDHFHVQGGALGGTPRVRGANQIGGRLVTDGWLSAQSNVLLAGDQISVNGRLHIVEASVSSAVGGTATLGIFPAMRVSPADNSTIITSNPRGLWRLMSYPVISDVPRFSSITLSFVQKMDN